MSYYLLNQQRIALYPDGIPNSRFDQADISDENQPMLYAYELEKAKKAVLIIPGGGYARVALQHEGEAVAQRFQEEGYQAFVLYYRLPKKEWWHDAEYAPLEDAQRAMLLIRELYAPDSLGVVGFSAGGHIAAAVANHYDDMHIANPKGLSLKPDFSVLVYPVITMKAPLAHKGAVKNLLGESPSAERVAYFSLEEQVTKETPPTFLVHAKDDYVVPIAHSLVYKDSLTGYNVPHDSFFYETGGHGFGLTNKTDTHLWIDDLFTWLDTLI